MYSKKLWIIFILVVSTASLVGELANHKFKMLDFEVYYKTASRITYHAELYSIAEDGHYVYKYSPVAGLFFIPFALLNYKVAALLYWALLTGLLIFGLNTFFKSTEEANCFSNKEKISTITILSTLPVLVHIHREWHLGQVNMLLLMIYLFMLHLYSKKYQASFSILLSASIFIKPFGLIFLPYLLLKKQFKIVLYSFIFCIVLALSPMLFYPSFYQLSHLYVSWWNELAIELSAKQNLLTDSNHTIFSVLARFTPLKFILVNSLAQKIYQLVVLLGLGFAFLQFSAKQRQHDAVLKEFSFLIALIPLLAFTSENAFIFELPVILFLIYSFNTLTTSQRVLVVIGCTLIGANVYDLLGSELSTYLISISVYTFGSLILLGVLFFNSKKAIIKL
jgi:hypothetical protein